MPALSTGLRCLAGQWVLQYGCCAAFLANMSVEVRVAVICLRVAILMHTMKIRCLVYLNRSSGSRAGLYHGLLPRPKDYALGNGSEVFFALHTPFVLLIAMGSVVLSWWILCILMWPIRKSKCVLAQTKSETGMTRTTLLLMFIIFILVLTLVPWQVAFLISWSIHLVTCATHLATPSPPGDASTPPPRTRSPSPHPSRRTQKHPPPHDAEHTLLLLMWILPLTVPVLAVWARTLAVADLGAAVSTVGGDHNVLSVAPYLVLVDFASWTHNVLFPPDRCAAALSCFVFAD